MSNELRELESVIDDLFGMMFRPIPRRPAGITIVVNIKGKTPEPEPKKEEPKVEVVDGGGPEPDNCIVMPADDLHFHTEPVFGVFRTSGENDVSFRIGNQVIHMDAKDAKALYARLGPALRMYKKEHPE